MPAADIGQSVRELVDILYVALRRKTERADVAAELVDFDVGKVCELGRVSLAREEERETEDAFVLDSVERVDDENE